ncbi:hypothetical protein HZA44_03540 [Candidatus Peregrinibacteria bacterium]|nr:hypothetical protein [Candidatus Peregrinibacteria bacterium]
MADKPHLRLVPSVDESLDREVADLPYFAVPQEMNPDSLRQYSELVMANCAYVLEHGDAMTDEQCYMILKKFDKKFLKVKKTDEAILVWDPENPEHHNQSVKKRLLDLCRNFRKRYLESLNPPAPTPKSNTTKG